MVEVEDNPTDAPGDQTTRLDIQVSVHQDHRDLAGALGWGAGVPGASVYVARVDQARYLWDTLVADVNGRVVLSDVAAGIYWVGAEQRVPAGGSAIGEASRVAGILAGGETVVVPVEETTRLPVPLKLDIPGSLVISEVFMDSPPPWETGDRAFNGSKYFELFNNGENTVFLDGMLLAHLYSSYRELGAYGHHSCSSSRPMREDPSGVWADVIWQFPGSGGEYPVAPGGVVVVAVAAADHTGVHASALDLSDADFELDPLGGADNPAAPNLASVGPLVGTAMEGRGLNGAVPFYALASRVDVQSLVLEQDPGIGTTREYRRIPAERILDVAMTWLDTSNSEITRVAPCPHPVHPSFDRLPGGYIPQGLDPASASASRRLVPLYSGGGSVLLDTNTSKVDFARTLRTPGWVN